MNGPNGRHEKKTAGVLTADSTDGRGFLDFHPRPSVSSAVNSLDARRSGLRNARMNGPNGLMHGAFPLTHRSFARMHGGFPRMDGANREMERAFGEVQRAFVEMGRALGCCAAAFRGRIRQDGAGKRQDAGRTAARSGRLRDKQGAACATQWPQPIAHALLSPRACLMVRRRSASRVRHKLPWGW